MIFGESPVICYCFAKVQVLPFLSLNLEILVGDCSVTRALGLSFQFYAIEE
ncbi:hypothetical protein SLEP1_g25725 [Rubroshorea leprosula]|uniref:Uncharacterized protein n=1 Tax=Rubroshorea leprosula TaxID=152421 RepID=A0AAV5JUA2_9ROSI|nr:hypothetical protein SLEP1_g25725 [Rubroshorea leprosula]